MSNSNEIDNKDPYLSIDASSEEGIPENKNVDLLAEKLEHIKANAPQTDEQFYQESFDIFNKLISAVKEHESKTLDTTNDSDILGFIEDYMDLTHDYSKTEQYTAIWDLVLRLFFNNSNDLTSKLIEWLDDNYPLPDIEQLKESNTTDSEWIHEAIERRLVRGSLDDAIELLEYSLEFIDSEDHSATNSLIDLLSEFQEMRAQVDDEAVYKEKWINWHQNCQFTLENNNLESHISVWYSILTGQIPTTCSFFEKLVGSMLYARPLLGLPGLNSLAQDIELEKFDTDVDLVCAKLIQGCYDDALDAMRESNWLQAHLGHILIVLGYYQKGEESLTKLNDGEEILPAVYYAINEYASSIANEFDMWNEAVAYLSVCQENREIWVIQLLGEPALPTKSIEELRSVLETADEYNMPNVKKYVYQSIGKRFEKDNKIREATVEYGKAHDLESLDRIAHEEFNEYLRHGTLDNVVIDMEELKESPHYDVLIQYRLFRQHLEHKEWKEASNGLLQLLKNERLPPKFETVLLIDNLRILQESEHYYVSDQMLELLGVFKQICKETDEKFFTRYYKHVQHEQLLPQVVIAKLRESLAYKAATAPAVF